MFVSRHTYMNCHNFNGCAEKYRERVNATNHKEIEHWNEINLPESRHRSRLLRSLSAFRFLSHPNNRPWEAPFCISFIWRKQRTTTMITIANTFIQILVIVYKRYSKVIIFFSLTNVIFLYDFNIYHFPIQDKYLRD